VPKRGEVITKQDAKPNGAHPNVTSESEMPFAGGAIAATMGVDHGNYGTLPFYRMTEDLVMHNVRGWSSDTQFVAGLKQHQSNPNTGFCGAVFDHIFDSASVVTQDIVDYENELALAVGQGNVPAFLSCSYYESQNEWDNVGKPNPASLSTATTANAIAYETLAKGFPGSYCTDQDNYYLCSGMYVKVNDSANTEYVQVVCPETNGCTTHWSATFRYAHVAGTPISIDWAYQAAQHQLLLYNTLKANSSHPEFAKLVLTTIPFAQATNVAAAESAQESVTGRHLYEVADALNYHFGTCNAPAEESTYVGYQNSIAEALSAYGGSDPFSRRIYVTEATITPPDTFGNGSSSPYVPTTAGGCNAPQMQTAIYASFDPLYLYGMRYFTKLYDPILYDAASGNLSNSYADISGNPKPDYYFRANTLASSRTTLSTWQPYSCHHLRIRSLLTRPGAWATHLRRPSQEMSRLVARPFTACGACSRESIGWLFDRCRFAGCTRNILTNARAADRRTTGSARENRHQALIPHRRLWH